MSNGGSEQTAQGALLSLYVETSLRVGCGEGVLDESLQREKTSGYPFIPAAALKGAIRGETQAKRLDATKIAGLLGGAHGVAGALSVTDARLILFPVRSASGVFAWVTCPMALARLRRDVALVGGKDLTLPFCENLDASGAFVPQECPMLVGESVVLEEFCFKAHASSEVGMLAEWLAAHLLPKEDVFEFWRAKLCASLVIVHDDVFRDFVTFSTEVGARLAVNPETQAAKGGAHYEEYLPGETVLYALLIAESTSTEGHTVSAGDALHEIGQLNLDVLQLGAGRSLGKGLCRVRVADASDVGE